MSEAIEPFTATGHNTRAEPDRYRVVCLECQWFMYAPEVDTQGLKKMGWRHRDATKLR